MKQENLIKRLREAYFFSACVQACYTPFYIIFLKSKNLDYFQIGLCFALSALVGAICQPVWGYVADRYLSKKKVLLILMTGSDLAALLVILSNAFSTVLIMTVFLSIFMPSVATVLDSLCMGISLVNNKIDFNKMRLMNSIGWAICAVTAGIVVNNAFASASLILLIILNTICIVSVYGIKTDVRIQSHVLRFGSIVDLLKDRKFSIFILSTLFLNIAISTHGNYLEVLIKSTGGNVSILGIVFGIISLCEVPTFFFGKRILNRFNNLKLYSLCVALYGLRFALESFCTSWQVVVVIQIMQFATYALYFLSALNYLSEIVDSRMLTTGLTLHGAIGGGFGGFIGNIFGGYILQMYNIQVLLRILTGVCVVAFITVLFVNHRTKDEKHFALECETESNKGII
jgi:MFS transporter, PPP family, 3-phenylpropionic acid transporter